MAEVNAKDLTTKTTPASTDSMLLFGTTSNEGAKITVDNLADNILGRLTTKTFANQVGGSSAATLLAQLSTLNSKTTNNITVEYNSTVSILQSIKNSVLNGTIPNNYAGRYTYGSAYYMSGIWYYVNNNYYASYLITNTYGAITMVWANSENWYSATVTKGGSTVIE